MQDRGSSSNSLWSLRADVLSAKILVWVASVGREGELTPEAHAYFCDRYRRLADCYRRRARFEAAERAAVKAREHCGDEGPPYSAAIAMPRPARWVRTWTVSGRDDPDDAA